MKILYVLTSSESDFYCEQAIISMMSAKHHMPSSVISLLMDTETDSNLKGTRGVINDYISEKTVINIDSSLSPTQKSRWLKTSMRKLVKGDFLYVDVDTVFAAPIDESLFTHNIMGVPDGNCLLKDHPLKWQIEDNLKKLHFNNTFDYYINGGVLFLKDSPAAHSFACEWHKRWQESCSKGIFIDQPALHQAFIDSNQEQHLLPNFMNAQFGRNINTLADGIILHYYASWTKDTIYTPAFKFLQKEWLQNFRNDPNSETFKTNIYNPKKAFDKNSIIMGQNFDLFFHSKLGHQFAAMHTSTNNADIRLYHFLERQNECISKLYYKIINYFYPIKKLFHKITGK